MIFGLYLIILGKILYFLFRRVIKGNQKYKDNSYQLIFLQVKR